MNINTFSAEPPTFVEFTQENESKPVVLSPLPALSPSKQAPHDNLHYMKRKPDAILLKR